MLGTGDFRILGPETWICNLLMYGIVPTGYFWTSHHAQYQLLLFSLRTDAEPLMKICKDCRCDKESAASMIAEEQSRNLGHQ